MAVVQNETTIISPQCHTPLSQANRRRWLNCFWELELQLILKTGWGLAAVTVVLVLGTECVDVVQNETTTLHYTVSNNSREVAKLLLGAGASIDATNKVRPDCSCLGC